MIILENNYKLDSSRKVMLKLMRDTLKDFIKLPHKEIGVIFEETTTFPKEYYFITFNQQLLDKVITSCKVEIVECPTDQLADFNFFGNKKLFKQLQ